MLGKDTSTALKKDGTVWAWGDNAYRNDDGSIRTDPYNGNEAMYGKLGFDSPQELITTPIELTYYVEDPTLPDDQLSKKDFKNILRVVSGDNHTLALDATGRVYAWGDNTYGQLGFRVRSGDSMGGILYSNYPALVNIPGNPFIISIAAGSNHSLALASDGSVYAWGRNNAGQLGNGKTTNDNAAAINAAYTWVPTRMKGFSDLYLDNVLEVAATAATSAVLLTDGTVWTVGSNLHGELGSGLYPVSGDSEAAKATQGSLTLVRVKYSAESRDRVGNVVERQEIRDINKIVGNGYNFAIISEEKEAFVWGDNMSHQVGAEKWLYTNASGAEWFGADDFATQPVKVQVGTKDMSADLDMTLKNVVDISIGGYQSADESNSSPVQILAVTMDAVYDYSGAVRKVISRDYQSWGWGNNENYKTGMDANVGYVNRAQKIEIFQPSNGVTYLEEGVQLQSLAAGGNHSAAFDTRGIVWTWGSNHYGQIGNFTYGMDPLHPDEILIQNKPSRVDEPHIAVYKVVEELNDQGELVRTETGNYNFQIKVPTTLETVTYDAAGNEIGRTSTSDAGVTDRLVAKYMYSFSVDKEVDEEKTRQLTYEALDGDIMGLSGLSTAGDDIGTRQSHLSYSTDGLRTEIITYDDVTISGKEYGSTRLIVRYKPKETGGEAGDRVVDAEMTGVAIVNILGPDESEKTVTNYDAGGNIIPEGDTTTAVGQSVVKEQVSHAFVALPKVAAGDGFSIALQIDGTVLAWGHNDKGQLGNGIEGEMSLTPEVVNFDFASAYADAADQRYIIQIAAGRDHAMALDNMGVVWVWGSNEYGQLGLSLEPDPITGENTIFRTPQPVTLDGATITGIFASEKTSYFVDPHGILFAAGDGEEFMLEAAKVKYPTLTDA